MTTDAGPALQLDRQSLGTRYYRNAVERHWDPFDIDISEDSGNLRAYLEDIEEPDTAFEIFRQGVARFGAGEQAVTEDLAPLATALEDIDDQMFVTTQIYEEAKHTDFFDRYWREVINRVERDLDRPLSSPTDQRWFNESYDELFGRTKQAMHRLLEDPSPENYARAYTHYHLVIEGILAQTGYYGMQRSFSPDEFPGLPHLPGLHDGFTQIRQDEGRHVGFGMAKLKALVESGDIDPRLIDDLVTELMPLVNDITAQDMEAIEERGIQPAELQQYAGEKHVERMEQIRDADAELPDVETLTKLEEA